MLHRSLLVFNWQQQITTPQLDKSMACRHLKSPQSLSVRSLQLHLDLVTKMSWSWSWMTQTYPFCSISIGLSFLRYSYFKIWPRKSCSRPCMWQKFKVTGRLSKQLICFLFVSHQSALPFLRYSHLTLKIQRQGHDKGQNSWLHLRSSQSICSFFVLWQSDHFVIIKSKFFI